MKMKILIELAPSMGLYTRVTWYLGNQISREDGPCSSVFYSNGAWSHMSGCADQSYHQYARTQGFGSRNSR
jgi:hypothetical protein